MKRILVLSQQCLFGKGVETLLSKEVGIELVKWDAATTTAFECIRAATPDVVIVDCDDTELELSPAIRCILRERTSTSIIGLSLEHNEISVYRGEHQEIFQVADLLKVIKD